MAGGVNVKGKRFKEKGSRYKEMKRNITRNLHQIESSLTPAGNMNGFCSFLLTGHVNFFMNNKFVAFTII